MLVLLGRLELQAFQDHQDHLGHRGLKEIKVLLDKKEVQVTKVLPVMLGHQELPELRDLQERMVLLDNLVRQVHLAIVGQRVSLAPQEI